MGFRNPITTAAAIDTRATPATPGVRMYASPNPDGTGSTYGVVEWTDGTAGDTPARATQTAYPNPRSQVDPYGRLTFTGGTYAAPGGSAAAPSWSLGAEQDPNTGAALPQGRLTGGQLVLDRPATSTGAGEQWTPLPFSTVWVAWDTAGNAPQYRRDVAGEVHLRGIVKLNAATGAQLNAGSGVAVCTMPPGFYNPSGNVERVVPLLNASGVWVAAVWAYITSAGVLTVVNNSTALAASGYGFALGLSYPST